MQLPSMNLASEARRLPTHIGALPAAWPASAMAEPCAQRGYFATDRRPCRTAIDFLGRTDAGLNPGGHGRTMGSGINEDAPM